MSDKEMDGMQCTSGVNSVERVRPVERVMIFGRTSMVWRLCFVLFVHTVVEI